MSQSEQHERPVWFPPPDRAQQVSEGIYAYIQPDGSWWINNAGFLVGSRGVISIDACSTERRTRAYLGAIARVSDQPVRTLLNTHHHGDHTFGNSLFTSATIVGQDRTRAAMQTWGAPTSDPYWTDVDFGEVELAPPFLTYSDGVTMYADDLRCEVSYVGAPAHTTDDSIVWIPERKVLFSGDLLINGGTPFLLQGSITGALRAVDKLAGLGAETIVPGHGPLCGPEVMEGVTDYLLFVQDVARRGRGAGQSPLEIARDTDLGTFATLLDPERLLGNLHRAYAELDGAPPGAPIDFPAALQDMVSFNGGQPLTCHA
jgi:cyclase